MTTQALRTPPGTIVQLVGGGVDSLCIWSLLDEPTAVHVNWGQRYYAHESVAVNNLDALPFAGPQMGGTEQPDGHVPHRNLALLATVANVYPDADALVLGAVRGESSPDKSARFLRAASKVLSASEHRAIKVVAPARHLNKTQLVAAYLDTVDHDWGTCELRSTLSCYAPLGDPWNAQHCGQCMACFRRWVAFTLNGVDTARHFAADPARWPGAHPDARRALAYLRRAPLAEWPHIARSNLDAWRALHAG